MGRLPRPAAMTADEFRSLIDAAGVSVDETAAILSVNSATVFRWLHARSSISEARAKLIRERIKDKMIKSLSDLLRKHLPGQDLRQQAGICRIGS
jgi:hypothetical protein